MFKDNKNIEIIKSVKFDYGIIELRSDNIMTYEPIDGITTLTLPQLDIMLELLLAVSDGIPRPYFSNNTNLKSLGSKERISIANNIHRFACACAITENSAITRFINYTFMQLSRPTIPVKMFKEKEDAFAWLRTFNN